MSIGINNHSESVQLSQPMELTFQHFDKQVIAYNTEIFFNGNTDDVTVNCLFLYGVIIIIGSQI